VLDEHLVVDRADVRGQLPAHVLLELARLTAPVEVVGAAVAVLRCVLVEDDVDAEGREEALRMGGQRRVEANADAAAHLREPPEDPVDGVEDHADSEEDDDPPWDADFFGQPA
jgi:hypothetical protein